MKEDYFYGKSNLYTDVLKGYVKKYVKLFFIIFTKLKITQAIKIAYSIKFYHFC